MFVKPEFYKKTPLIYYLHCVYKYLISVQFTLVQRIFCVCLKANLQLTCLQYCLDMECYFKFLNVIALKCWVRYVMRAMNTFQ